MYLLGTASDKQKKHQQNQSKVNQMSFLPFLIRLIFVKLFACSRFRPMLIASDLHLASN